MPVPGHSYGMPVARQPDPRREIAGVILGGPDAVPRHFDWREPQPFRAGCAVNVPVQPRVIREDLQAAADKQDEKEEIDVMVDAQPGGKAKGRRHFPWIYNRKGG